MHKLKALDILLASTYGPRHVHAGTGEGDLAVPELFVREHASDEAIAVQVAVLQSGLYEDVGVWSDFVSGQAGWTVGSDGAVQSGGFGAIGWGSVEKWPGASGAV